jgi:hypothetical protein
MRPRRGLLPLTRPGRPFRAALLVLGGFILAQGIPNTASCTSPACYRGSDTVARTRWWRGVDSISFARADTDVRM